MKVLCLSNRFYYRELDDHVKEVIHHDLEIYNKVLHKAYKLNYDKKYKGVYMEDKDIHQILKHEFNLNDYIPLSATNEAKALLKAREEHHAYLVKQTNERIKKIKKKIKTLEKQLKKTLKEKDKYIKKSKQKKTTNEDYLYEVQVIDPKIKTLRNKIKMINYKLTREIQKKENYEQGVKAICFGGRRNLKSDINKYKAKRKNRMLITGRRQGKYSNNLFKYHVDEGMMVYRGTDEEIKLPITFHHNKEHLEKAVRMKHNTPNKAVAYELYDHGEYFIIKAIIEYEEEVVESQYGSIGIDINKGHIAVAQIDAYGNLVDTSTIPLKTKGLTTGQREYKRIMAVNEIVEMAKKSKKNLVIENLDFKKRKANSLYENKKENEMISEFAYKKLIEKIERKCTYEKVKLTKVKPEYTSMIGKLKYAKRLGLSIHHSAAYVIARRGEGYSERVPNEYREMKGNKKTRDEQWREIGKIIGKATLEECQRTPILCLFR